MKKDEEAVAQEKRLKERMGRVKHKIMVMNGKDGVRKTVAVNLALTAKRYEVGIMDANIHSLNQATAALHSCRSKSEADQCLREDR